MDEMKPQKTAGVHACTESGCSCAHDHHGHHEHHEHSEHHHEHHEHGCSCGHSHDGCGCGHDHGAEHSRKELVILAAGAVLLILGEILSGPFAKAILLTAFLFVAFDVLVEATKNIRRNRFSKKSDAGKTRVSALIKSAPTSKKTSLPMFIKNIRKKWSR